MLKYFILVFALLHLSLAGYFLYRQELWAGIGFACAFAGFMFSFLLMYLGDVNHEVKQADERMKSWERYDESMKFTNQLQKN